MFYNRKGKNYAFKVVFDEMNDGMYGIIEIFSIYVYAIAMRSLQFKFYVIHLGGMLDFDVELFATSSIL